MFILKTSLSLLLFFVFIIYFTIRKVNPLCEKIIYTRKKVGGRPTSPAESRTSLSGLYTFTPSGHEIRHKRLARFCASQGSFTYHALRVHHISGGPPFGTAPTSYEPRATNHKKALAVVPPLLPNLGHLCLACIPSHHQVTRFGISDSHGFARRKAPSKPVPCLSQGTLVG